MCVYVLPPIFVFISLSDHLVSGLWLSYLRVLRLCCVLTACFLPLYFVSNSYVLVFLWDFFSISISWLSFGCGLLFICLAVINLLACSCHYSGCVLRFGCIVVAGLPIFFLLSIVYFFAVFFFIAAFGCCCCCSILGSYSRSSSIHLLCVRASVG